MECTKELAFKMFIGMVNAGIIDQFKVIAAILYRGCKSTGASAWPNKWWVI